MENNSRVEWAINVLSSWPGAVSCHPCLGIHKWVKEREGSIGCSSFPRLNEIVRQFAFDFDNFSVLDSLIGCYFLIKLINIHDYSISFSKHSMGDRYKSPRGIFETEKMFSYFVGWWWVQSVRQ